MDTPASGTAASPVQKQPSAGSARWLRWLLTLLLVALAVAAALWLWGRLRPPQMHGTVLQSPEPVADLVLTGPGGQPVALSDFQGRWTALYFGYTFCPDVCPTTLADLRSTMDQLGRRADDLQVVLISVDPARDTPERLESYLAYFHPEFVGLTGSPEAVDAAATQFGVFYEARTVEGASGYLIDHTSTVIVLDPEGHIRILFPYGTSGADMAADLLYLMRRG